MCIRDRTEILKAARYYPTQDKTQALKKEAVDPEKQDKIRADLLQPNMREFMDAAFYEARKAADYDLCTKIKGFQQKFLVVVENVQSQKRKAGEKEKSGKDEKKKQEAKDYDECIEALMRDIERRYQ